MVVVVVDPLGWWWCFLAGFLGSGCGVTGVCGVPGGGAHWALEHWYVTLCPKKVISEPNRPKIIPFDTQNYCSIF